MLHYKGYDISSLKPVLEQALQDGYITDELQWRRLQRHRNLITHTYNSETAEEIAENIVTDYYEILQKLALRLEEERGGKQIKIFT